MDTQNISLCVKSDMLGKDLQVFWASIGTLNAQLEGGRCCLTLAWLSFSQS